LLGFLGQYIQARRKVALIAPQQAFVFAALHDLVWHGVDEIVAKVFVEAAMPVAEQAVRGRAVRLIAGAQAQIGRLDLELVDGALDLTGLLRRLLRPDARRKAQS